MRGTSPHWLSTNHDKLIYSNWGLQDYWLVPLSDTRAPVMSREDGLPTLLDEAVIQLSLPN